MPKKTTKPPRATKQVEEEESVELLSAEGAESEEDLKQLDPSILGGAVVSSTDWTAETMIGQLAKGNIHLDPIFQRRDAWTAPPKSKFIESIILGLPIPQIVLAEARDKKGVFIVIDGKQRLLTLQQFAGINIPDDQEPLKLRELTVRKELIGKTYDDLKSDSRLENHLTAFDNQSIRTVVVKNWREEDLLYVIFHRLNTGSVPLSPQELRQALIPGPFLVYAAEHSETSQGLRKILRSKKPDFRMRDVELLVRYFAFKNFLTSYRGNLKEFLDSACVKLNSKWKQQEAEIKRQAVEFEAAIDASFLVFGDDAFRKWDGGKFERRFNRAIFDLMTFYLSDSNNRSKVLKKRAAIKASFKKLCESDSGFLEAVSTTTKSKVATSRRFTLWGQSLKKVIGPSIKIPAIR